MQILSTSHAPSGRPSLPSPTLTNPDMILPYDSPSSDSPPSTPRRVQQIPSPPPFSRTSPTQSTNSDEGAEMKGAMRRFFGNGERSKLQKSKGMKATKLSDRYEKSSAPSFEANGNSVLASSPTLHDNHTPTETDTAKMGEVFRKRFNSVGGGRQGSPDEEPAEFEDVGPPKYGFPPLDNEKDGFSAPPDVEDDDAYSHAAMSIRAEQILANAKKRLTNMEGNLNRARSTLHNRPSSSMSSFSNQTPDPVSLYTIPQGNLSPSKHRQAIHTAVGAGSKGHNRVFSETSVPSSLQTPPQGHHEDTQMARASSAMGSSSLNTPGENHPDNAHTWFWTGLTRNTSYAQRHNYSLPALEEDGPAPESFEPSPTAEDHIQEAEEGKEPAKDEAIPKKEPRRFAKSPSFDLGSSPTVGLTRARSTTQMRDLRDQMQDLKGKISSLKWRAREDSMRRRSMQSLRTPSPFTAAEDWQRDDSGLRQGTQQLGDGAESSATDDETRSKGGDKSPRLNTDRRSGGSQRIEASFDESDFALTPRSNGSLQADSAKLDMKQSIGEPFQFTKGGELGPSSGSETDETLNDYSQDFDRTQGSDHTAEQDSLHGDQEYHDTFPSQKGERHEDRPDAFDYETFFLHSGTGILARKSHSRDSSHSSLYSVETTKPTYAPNEDSGDLSNGNDSSPVSATPRRATSRQKERGHARNESRESISTVATFATATEGKDSDGEGDEDEWILERPMAGAWTNDQSSKRKISPRSLESSAELSRTGSGSSKRSAPFRKGATSANAIDTILVPIPSVPQQHLDATPLSPPSASLAVLSREAAQLPDADKELVEMLVNSLAKVCARLKDKSLENEQPEVRAWRRKLDTARRTLDDEMNGEAF